MKTFSASQLSRNPEAIYSAAKSQRVIIQRKATNGEIKEEFILVCTELKTDAGN